MIDINILNAKDLSFEQRDRESEIEEKLFHFYCSFAACVWLCLKDYILNQFFTTIDNQENTCTQTALPLPATKVQTIYYSR